MFSKEKIDPTAYVRGASEMYDRKVSIMNRALMDIGMGKYQWKLFILVMVGWFCDILWTQAGNIIGITVRNEFPSHNIALLNLGRTIGVAVGGIFWSFTSDYIGRRPSFTITLGLATFFGLLAAGMPEFISLTSVVAFTGFALGGNQFVDGAIFVEFIPATHQFLLSLATIANGLSTAYAVLVAWPLLLEHSCTEEEGHNRECSYYKNIGWRYALWIYGSTTAVFFVLRFTFGLKETPKYLLSRGMDARAVEVVHHIATHNGKETWLTVDDFQAIDRELAGSVSSGTTDTEISCNKDLSPRPEPTDDEVGSPGKPVSVFKTKLQNYRPEKLIALFSTPKAAISNSIIFAIWLLGHTAYTLFNSFLPFFIQTQAKRLGNYSLSVLFRLYVYAAVCGLAGSALAAVCSEIKYLGRKGTGALSCLLNGVFLFLFTRAKSHESLTGFVCAIGFLQAISFGIWYGCTPELFPAPLRGTALGLVAAFSKVGGLVAILLGMFVGLDNEYPVWTCGSLYLACGLLFFALPYEMRGRAAS